MLSITSLNSKTSKLALSLVFVASLAACGGSDDPVPAVIALADAPALTISPTTATAATAALTAAPAGFTFPAGVPAFGTTAATTVAFTAPAAGTTTPAFSIKSGTGTATGTVSYGSCIFNVTTSTVPGIVAPTTITVNPCAFDANTAGKTVTAGSTATITVPAALILGAATSTAANVTITVTNNGATNTLTVNGGSLGSVTGTVTTGASGG